MPVGGKNSGTQWLDYKKHGLEVFNGPSIKGLAVGWQLSVPLPGSAAGHDNKQKQKKGGDRHQKGQEQSWESYLSKVQRAYSDKYKGSTKSGDMYKALSLGFLA